MSFANVVTIRTLTRPRLTPSDVLAIRELVAVGVLGRQRTMEAIGSRRRGKTTLQVR